MNKKNIVLTLLVFASVSAFLKLSQIRQMNFSSKMIFDKNGILLREIYSSEYGTAYPIKLEKLPKHFVDTVITAEDKRFFYHPGIDPIAISRAMLQNIKARKIVSGGSTITQQLVRNTYFYPRTLPYKLLESLQSVCIELRYSKKRILEEYLNRIPYGNGAYGIEAASRLYFAKPAQDLTLAESAFLCAIPSSNKLFDPYKKLPSALKRQKKILKLMCFKGKIGKTEYDISVGENLLLYPKERKFLAPHFCEWIIENYGRRLPEKTETTLDYNLQKKIEFIVNNHISKLKSANVNNVSVVVIDNLTGGIPALVGSSNFFDEKYSGQVNGALALRQPGSAIKPFVYGLAFETGFTASDTIPDLETGIKIDQSGFFLPKNYDKKYHGMVRLRTALACSYNVATTNLASYLGPDQILSKLHQAGLESLKKDAKFYGSGLCLGNGEVTLVELSRAYSAFANKGRLKSLRLLKSEPSFDCGAVFSPEISYIVTDILSDNNARAPAFGEFSPLNLPFRCAVKTGTSKNFRDNWTVGYTPKYTVAVWAGNFSGKPMYSVSGISGAGPIFRDIMLTLEARNKNPDFIMPGGIKKIRICSKSGKLPLKQCSEVLEEIFLNANVPGQYCDIHKVYKIDKRNGLTAIKNCPQQYIEKKVYEVYPIEYYNWALNSGIELPPQRTSNIPVQDTGMAENGYFDIDSPADGDIFKLDPVLRKEYQCITLAPKVSAGILSIKWFIDNKPVIANAYPFSVRWEMEKGKHAINYIAEKKDGTFAKSRNIEITIVD